MTPSEPGVPSPVPLSSPSRGDTHPLTQSCRPLEDRQKAQLSPTPREGRGWDGGPVTGVRQRIQDRGGSRVLLAQGPGGYLARKCLVMGARETKQWQDFSKTGGKDGERQG